MTDEKRTDCCFLRDLIDDVPDFPEPGVSFKDIGPLLGHDDCFRFAIDSLADHFSGRDIGAIAGIDARGFLLAAPVAYRLGVGLVLIRKAKKLPGEVLTQSYDLEYGTDTIEMQAASLAPGTRTVIIDDVLATGGTAAAAAKLVAQAEAELVSYGFLAELDFLDGRSLLDAPVFTLVNFDGNG